MHKAERMVRYFKAAWQVCVNDFYGMVGPFALANKLVVILKAGRMTC
jgi:hypothetical protein